VKEGPAIEIIEEEIRARNSDLLVLGAHRRTWAVRPLFGSVTLKQAW
jgi:nucleotide-binding universal stress UspA family protein